MPISCTSRCAAAGLLLAALLLPSPSRAQIVFAGDTVAAKPLAMSISGAISVGSYQAGVNWGLLEVFRRAAHDARFDSAFQVPRYRLKAVSGASAGNINTLLWAIEACTVPGSAVLPPDSSLFWRVWVGIGLPDLLPGGGYRAGSDPALLDRARIRAITDPPVRERLRRGDLAPGCRVPVGITLTRIQPDTLRLQGLEIETQRFATVFMAAVDTVPRINGERMKFLQLRSKPEEDQHFGKIVLLNPREGPIVADTVLEAVQASSAYPVAFAPVSLLVWHSDEGEYQPDVFLDGGVFDNNPINLVLDLYRIENGGTGAAHVDVLYINPGKYRGRLAQIRSPTGSRPVAAGGLSAATQFLGGAVSTARQYELQLLARERELLSQSRIQQARLRRALSQRDRAYFRLDTLSRRLFRLPQAADSAQRDSLLGELVGLLQGVDSASLDESAIPDSLRWPYNLRLSTRNYPLYSEHLNAFAGFLGRPLREFDFYVGLYDALHLTAQQFSCAGTAPPAHRDCVEWKLAALIRDPALVPGHARALLASLYDAEFHNGEAVLRKGVASPADSLARERETVLLGLFGALAHEYRPADPGAESCQEIAAVARLMCAQGLERAFAVIRADRPTMRILKRWAESCGDGPTHACMADKRFVKLVEDSGREATRVAHRLLTRLLSVEAGLAEQGLPDKQVLATGLNWAYYSSALRLRPPFELQPTAIPTRRLVLWHFVPYYLGTTFGTSAYEARLRPTLNFPGAAWAATFPVILHRTFQPHLDSDRNWFGSLGLGVARRSPLRNLAILVPEAGVEGHLWTPLHKRKVPGEPTWIGEAEGYVTVLGGARFGLRFATDAGYLHGAHSWGVSVGITDLGGLLYWMGQSL